jgi:hypothetical protein
MFRGRVAVRALGVGSWPSALDARLGDARFRLAGSAVRALQTMVHNGAQIVAVYHAWNESVARLDFRHGVELRARTCKSSFVKLLHIRQADNAMVSTCP